MLPLSLLPMKRLSILLLPLVLAACAPAPSTDTSGSAFSSSASAAAQTGSLDAMTASSGADATMEIETRDVEYAEINGKVIKGYLAAPKSEPGAKYPGLVLIHQWWGLNDNMREYAEQFAKQGYVALAVDLYEGESTTDQQKAGQLASAVQNNMDKTFGNLKQAVAFLKKQPNVLTDRLASVGWCFGGGWSYQMAKNDLGVRATVMYYGRFNTEDDLAQMKAHIMGHFGENDTSIKVDDVRQFEVKLKTLSGENSVFIYPNAGHGFANSDNAAAYNPQAAAEAWRRTIDFLRENLYQE